MIDQYNALTADLQKLGAVQSAVDLLEEIDESEESLS
jgi:hypothetical protein